MTTSTIPVIQIADKRFNSHFHNKPRIYCEKLKDGCTVSPAIPVIEQLAKDLKAANPVIVNVRNERIWKDWIYLVADRFEVIQSQINNALDKKEFEINNLVENYGTVLLLKVSNDLFYKGYPKSFYPDDYDNWWIPGNAVAYSYGYIEFDKID